MLRLEVQRLLMAVSCRLDLLIFHWSNVRYRGEQTFYLTLAESGCGVSALRSTAVFELPG
jgi:hypothetical protein